MASDFKIWKRKLGFGPGHDRIFVLVSGEGELVAASSVKPNEIQCATMDRIPFVMKVNGLRERYEPEPEVSK